MSGALLRRCHRDGCNRVVMSNTPSTLAILHTISVATEVNVCKGHDLMTPRCTFYCPGGPDRLSEGANDVT